MNKVLCENGRYGSRSKTYRPTAKSKAKITAWPFGEPGGKEGIKAMHRVPKARDKSFGENLNPLYRFIDSSVGKKWNKVYSEICQNFDKRKVINDHILIHLYQYVCREAVWKDGKVMVLDRSYYGGGYIPIAESSYETYVHPVSGLLLKNVGKVSYKKKAAVAAAKRLQVRDSNVKKVTTLPGGDTFWHIKIKNVWYGIRVSKIPTYTATEYDFKTHKVVKVVRGVPVDSHSVEGAVSLPDPMRLHPSSYYVKAKRQLSTQELKKHGLKK